MDTHIESTLAPRVLLSKFGTREAAAVMEAHLIRDMKKDGLLEGNINYKNNDKGGEGPLIERFAYTDHWVYLVLRTI